MREVQCPKGHRLQITELHLGKQVRCPICSDTFTVPETLSPATGPLGESSQPPIFPPQATLATPPRVPRSLAWPPWLRNSLYLGRPLVMLGLLLVLGARGCDALGKRNVEGAKARELLAEKKFEDTWDEKRGKIEDRIKRLSDAETSTEESSKELSKAREELSKLRDDQQKEKAALGRGAWRDLKIKARDAAAKNQISAYWRECTFILGTILLAFGLMIVSWSAQGAERWISLIILAIITFSLYVVGLDRAADVMGR